MATIRFEWDPAKASANLRKHGVGFEEARGALADEFARVIHDEAGEADEVIRIISARRAGRSERQQYTRHLP